jgi:arylsulfatase A-like enzyme
VSPTAERYDVLFVTIDSLRRDVLGAYPDRPNGFEYVVETPTLNAFADRALVFKNKKN